MKCLFIPVTTFAVMLVMSACGANSTDGASGDPLSSARGSVPPAQPNGGSNATASDGDGPSAGGGTGGGGTGGGTLTPAQRETLSKLRACMIQKGYDMPEINPNNPVMAPKNNNGKSNDQVNQDAAECATQSQGG